MRTDLDMTGTEQPDALVEAVMSEVSGVSDWRLTALDQVSGRGGRPVLVRSGLGVEARQRTWERGATAC